MKLRAARLPAAARGLARALKWSVPVITVGVLIFFAGSNHTSSAAEQPGLVQGTNASPVSDATAGRVVFLKNCAHCHGADAHGDEGPDLHDLDRSDQWIASRIRNGKKGQMTAFDGKLKPAEINVVIAYLRTLK